MPFKKGNKLNVDNGGYKQRGGRMSHWLKDECDRFLRKDKLVEFMAQVARGEDVREEAKILDDGRVIKYRISADIRDRMKAVEYLSDRGFGKAAQSIELTGTISLESIIAKQGEDQERLENEDQDIIEGEAVVLNLEERAVNE